MNCNAWLVARVDHSVKPSAMPSRVRILHPPPTVQTASEQAIRPAGAELVGPAESGRIRLSTAVRGNIVGNACRTCAGVDLPVGSGDPAGLRAGWMLP